MSDAGGRFPPVAEQLDRLRRGVVDLTTPAEFRQKLARSRAAGRPLTIKVGFDPTAPDIHLGHTVLMRKMREFQDLGHQVVYVIGDFTALIGDPSGRTKTRPPLSRAEIVAHAESYTEQAFKILDPARTMTRFNSEWLSALGAEGLIRLAGRYTVARMLERRDFKERLASGAPISLHELLYPLAQAYDSVVLKADVELGGTDQLFNLNVGREIMPDYGIEPQVIITVPLLEGTDGVEKMSKSLNNAVGVTDPPSEMFGRVMSISDPLMLRWYELLTDDGAAGAVRLREDLAHGRVHPRELKIGLASLLVARFHGAAAAAAAADQFEQVFVRKAPPDAIEAREHVTAEATFPLAKLLAVTGATHSTSEGIRLIRQGAVWVDGQRASDAAATVTTDQAHLIKVGKRRFLRVVFKRPPRPRCD